MKPKALIRKESLEARSAFPEDRVRDASAVIAERVCLLREFILSEAVFCYLSAAGEVDTSAIIFHCGEVGKRVLIPAFKDVSGGYGIAEFDVRSGVETGRFGIPEPVAPRWINGDAVLRSVLSLIPGVAFGRNGGRVGHGKGFYDRLLEQPAVAGGLKAGLAFEFQLFEEVPVEKHDVVMDMVITEKGLYKTGGCYG